MTDDLERRLHELAAGAPAHLSGQRWQELPAGARRRARQRVGAVGALVLLLGAGAGAAVALPRGHVHDTVALSSLDGRVEASGRVVALPGRAPQLCAPAPTAAVRTDELQPCVAGVELQGVDLSRLDDTVHEKGATEGYATIAGRLDAGTLVVDHQGPRDDSSQQSEMLFGDRLPCPTPAGGWRDGAREQSTVLQAFVDSHPTAVEFALAHPKGTSFGTWFLVTDDPDGARAALGLSADTLCAVRSRFPAADFKRVAHDPVLSRLGGGLFEFASLDLDVDGQPYASGEAVVPTAALDQAVARYPAGLVRISYFLQPATDVPDGVPSATPRPAPTASPPPTQHRTTARWSSTRSLAGPSRSSWTSISLSPAASWSGSPRRCCW